ncbi:hypothetical protein A2861_00180 [Candidatus Roizmanbacteria bacterium RIFCSPHIGHO2_01_FULL_38_15]|nr:MAG: hypothetical protein A2861_00180 [Candidatus Roizmanbacteria bacterium RIFCSPHIGHO2_01_FULL_38_15]OGK36112.1 MAG: hypothetical protein A3F59_01425 [Candidatus Roizmanbacteria bacterium RIFCSPHIGHO2_12_FULL_38_13]
MKNSECTVIIHTHNESVNIAESINSAKLLTDNIIVIDMESKDNTANLAKKNGAQVFSFPFSHYVEPSREFGIKKAKTEWVFLLDADERITEKLAEEIQSIVMLNSFQHQDNKIPKPASQRGEQVRDDGNIPTHYKISRKNIFGKTKWLRHGGWWPDQQIRLINTKYFKAWPKDIHSTPKIEGEMAYLQNPIKHYFHGNLERMVDKTTIFENIESDLLYKANRSVKTPTFFRKFLGELYRRLIAKMGFLDGPLGVIESFYQAYSKTITYLYLYEKKNSRSL